MGRPKVKVVVEGIAALQAKLNNDGLLREPVRDMLTGAAKVGQKAAVEGVDGGRGIAVRSMSYKVDPLSMRVFTAMPAARARSIDQGRKPFRHGLRALLPGISRWREAVGHPDAGIVIALSIKKRGVKGRFFKQSARDAVNNVLPGLFKALELQVERFWRKSR